jgi:thioredoxin 1
VADNVNLGSGATARGASSDAPPPAAQVPASEMMGATACLQAVFSEAHWLQATSGTPQKHRATGPRAAGASLLACAILALLAAGCESRNLRPILNEADFQRQVLRADRPVVVDFYKGGGCPPCKMLLPILDQLADEYRGRVLFTSYEIISPFFQVTSEELKARYDIFYIPTVILFINGQEQKRWPLNFMIDDYRKVLDEVLARQAAREARLRRSVGNS